MRKYFVLLLVLGLALIPAVAGASRFITGQEYASPGQGSVPGNLYIAAGTVSVGAATSGDLIAAGGTISVTGTVGGDVLAAGGTIQILGDVEGDVRVVGGQVTISQEVRGDVMAAAGTVHILPSAVIDGDISLAGGQVILDGTVRGTLYVAAGSAAIHGAVTGDVRGRFGKLEIGSAARVGGNVVYRAQAEAMIADGARIDGTVMYTPLRRFQTSGTNWPAMAWAAVVGMATMKLLIFLGAAALVVWRFRRRAIDVMEEAVTRWWPSVGRGLAYAILIPLAAVLLLVSIIGILPGVVLWLAYFLLWVFARVLAAVFLGSLVVMAFRRSRALTITWASALIGVVLLSIVALIPLVGWIVQALLGLAMFGVLARRAHHLAW